MPDTRRLLSALQTLHADNTTGDISPQDNRDFLVSTYANAENIRNHGAVGDGVADDTTPFQAACAAAALAGVAVFFPAGIYLVKDGYTTATANEGIHMIGEGIHRSTTPPLSRIKFAPTATTKYLINTTLTCDLVVTDLQFEGVDPVDAGEMKMFRIASNCRHLFTRCVFEGNHHWSTYYETTADCQSSSYRDVQWGNCGTLGSASNVLFGTLLLLDNCNHESNVIVNTRLVVMDLRGWRQVQTVNLVLEGTLPADGTWTVIDIDHGATSAQLSNQNAGADCDGLWIEFGGNQPLHSVRMNGTICSFRQPFGLWAAATTLRLDNGSVCIVTGTTFSSDLLDPSTGAATFDDVYSRLIIEKTKVREVAGSLAPNPQVTLHDVFNMSTKLTTNVLVDTINNEVMYEWRGDLLRDNSVITHPAVSSTAHLRTIIPDATYGRLINIEKNGAAMPLWSITITAPAEWDGMTCQLQMYTKFPTATGGTFYKINTSGTVSEGLLDPVTQNAFKWYNLQIRFPVGGGALKFEVLSDHTTSSNPIQIAALRVSVGDAFGQFPSFAKETVTAVATLADDATPSVVGVKFAKSGGTTTITDFDDGVVGDSFTFLAAHSVTITDGTNMLLNGSANFVMVAGDTLTLAMIDDQVWEEVARKTN